MPVYDCGNPTCEECERAFGPDRAGAIATYNARLAATKIPPCRVCGSAKNVGMYHEQGPGETICPECCGKGAEHSDGETGHVWEYERFERDNVCQKCGVTEHDDEGYISDRERI